MEVNSLTANLKEVEAGVKNKFRWNWLEEKDADGHFLLSSLLLLVFASLIYDVLAPVQDQMRTRAMQMLRSYVRISLFKFSGNGFFGHLHPCTIHHTWHIQPWNGLLYGSRLCRSPLASGGFAPSTPTGALPLDPTRGP